MLFQINTALCCSEYSEACVCAGKGISALCGGSITLDTDSFPTYTPVRPRGNRSQLFDRYTYAPEGRSLQFSEHYTHTHEGQTLTV